jgi:hypothetical protein
MIYSVKLQLKHRSSVTCNLRSKTSPTVRFKDSTPLIHSSATCKTNSRVKQRPLLQEKRLEVLLELVELLVVLLELLKRAEKIQAQVMERIALKRVHLLEVIAAKKAKVKNNSRNNLLHSKRSCQSYQRMSRVQPSSN